jgi:hypothetical protein
MRAMIIQARAAALLVALSTHLAGCAPSPSRAGAGGGTAPDLPALAQSGGLRLVNRDAVTLDAPERPSVRLSAAAGDGLAWLDGVAFTTGTVRLDVRGRNAPGQSFVGIAFNGVDDQTYEAVYVRPFNFQATNPVQRDHAVQYIAHPTFTWNALREGRPEVFENPVVPPPDPDAWVPLRLEVTEDSVTVYVGEGDAPDLAVERLAERSGTRMGLWVGNNSAGDFANLRIDR